MTWVAQGTAVYADRSRATVLADVDVGGGSMAEKVQRANYIAALPDLFNLVLNYRDDLLRPPTDDSRDRRIAAIDAAIKKATAL